MVPEGILMKWDKPNYYENNDIKVIIPENTLYENLYFKYDRIVVDSGYYSDIHMIHNIYTPLHKAYTIAIRPKHFDEKLKKKALMVTLDGNNKISGTYVGEWKNEYLYVQSKSFGDYVITTDTTAPEIIPVKFSNGADLTNSKTICFNIRDELSGIKSYEGKIDGNWVLFEFDAKKNLLVYTFDPDKIKNRHEACNRAYSERQKR